MFFNLDTLDGRAILARFVITPLTPDSVRSEQSFSDDAGATWEVNWIATDTRVKGPGSAGSTTGAAAASGASSSAP